MSSIHLLDENTINQIAAGEVVERPSAVVKELVENAMDAKATAITVEIKDGGLSFIRITDNGSGIAREDIPLAFMRHATSKIYKAEDLLRITSLGFRGEALSSIAAVSQVELITKTSSALNGYRYIIEGGVEKSLEEIGCPTGTTIIVRNLFYNTPARRKFLKSASTEAGYIGDLMEKILVAHPEVAFKYIVNNQIKLQSSGNNNTKDILYSIYGRELTRDLLELKFDSENIKVRGFIGKPSINRSNRGYENYFVNGRFIKNNTITRAIEDAYKPFLMQHKYPFCSIYLDIEPSLIDVNVHPQKMELRLRNSDEIYRLLLELIRNTLTGNELIPKVGFDNPTVSKAENQNLPAMPEPFETNRRMQYQKEAGITPSQKHSVGRTPYESNKGQTGYQGYQRLSDKGSDYIAATKPLIQADIEIPGLLKADRSNLPTKELPFTNDTASKALTIAADTDAQNNPEYKDMLANAASALNEGNDLAVINEAKDPLIVNEGKDLPMVSESKDQSVFHDSTNQSMVNESNALPVDNESQLMINESGDRSAVNESKNQATVSESNKLPAVDNDFSNNLNQAANRPIADGLKTSAEQLSLFETTAAEDNAPFLSGKALEEHRIIGQLFSTYWLVEYKKNLYIIDQHAAHEKVLYERIMAAAANKTFYSQSLLTPIVLTLTLKEQEVLKKHEEVLATLGYEFEHFGGNEYQVRAVPADLYSLSEKALLLEFIDELAEETMGHIGSSTSILEKIASLSCKAAVKANHSMSYDEAKELIRELLTLDNPYNCPHGRPVIISMSQYELERKFKRVL